MPKMNCKRLQASVDWALKNKDPDNVTVFVKLDTLIDIVEDSCITIVTEDERTVLTCTDGSFITLVDAYGLIEGVAAAIVHCGNYNRNPHNTYEQTEQIIL